jgi:hypothetical protein
MFTEGEAASVNPLNAFGNLDSGLFAKIANKRSDGKISNEITENSEETILIINHNLLNRRSSQGQTCYAIHSARNANCRQGRTA